MKRNDKLKTETYKKHTIKFRKSFDGEGFAQVIGETDNGITGVGENKEKAFEMIKFRINKNLPSKSTNIQHKENKRIAEIIIKFIQKHELGGDLRIYYNGMAYDIDYNGNVKFVGHKKASNYMEYANDKGVNMTFEGAFYGIMNDYYNKHAVKLSEDFNKLLNKNGYYYELGNAWNLIVVKD